MITNFTPMIIKIKYIILLNGCISYPTFLAVGILPAR